MGQVIDLPRMHPHVEPVTGLTPWEVCQRLADREHLAFFDSASSLRAGELGRYSYVCAAPAVWLTSNRGWINENGQFAAIADPLTMLARRLADFALQPIEGLPPFQGG